MEKGAYRIDKLAGGCQSRRETPDTAYSEGIPAGMKIEQ